IATVAAAKNTAREVAESSGAAGCGADIVTLNQRINGCSRRKNSVPVSGDDISGGGCRTTYRRAVAEGDVYAVAVPPRLRTGRISADKISLYEITGNCS